MMWEIVGAVVVLYIIGAALVTLCKLLEWAFPSIWKGGRAEDDDNC